MERLLPHFVLASCWLGVCSLGMQRLESGLEVDLDMGGNYSNESVLEYSTSGEQGTLLNELIGVQGMPVDHRGKLQNPWKFYLDNLSAPCQADPAGEAIICEFEVHSITAADNNASSAPVFLARAVGPALEVCSQVKNVGSDGFFKSTIRCKLRDPGQYKLKIMLAYESQEDAYPSPPRCSVNCICSYLRVDGIWPKFDASPSLATELLSMGSQPQDSPFQAEHAVRVQPKGRWVKEPAGIAWRAYDKPERNWSSVAPLPPPEACPSMHFIGDSHMNRTYHFLDNRGYDVSHWFAAGIRDHNMRHLKDVITDAALNNCAGDINFGGENGRMCLLHQLQKVIEDPELQERGGVKPLIALGPGTWDLRDESVDDYVRDFKTMLEKVEEGIKIGALSPDRLILRNVPSYSYKRSFHILYGREYRTNAKLVDANKRVAALAAEHNLRLWDTFSITLPRFEESVDTHHYLDPVTANDIGVVDTAMLLDLVCNTTKSKAQPAASAPQLARQPAQAPQPSTSAPSV